MTGMSSSGARSSPNSVLLQSVTGEELCDIRLSLLPYTSGRHIAGVFLELLPGDGPFHPVRASPQQLQALHPCHLQLGGVVSVPRARLSPPCSHRTGVDT